MLIDVSQDVSLHTSSQPITSRVYQRLIYLLTNQVAHQGFWIFNWLKLSLDYEDGFRTGCRNVSRHQQSFSGLQSPRWSFFNQGIANIVVYKFELKKDTISGTSVTFHSWRIWPLAEQRNKTSCIRPSKPRLSGECFCKRQIKPWIT